MRIIAGTLKGRTLAAPTWDGLRPTSDKLRETLFNVLAPRISGARVVDGFAGTGAIGIEALSRNASEVAFIEQDPRAVALIEANLARCHVETRYAIIRAPFRKGVHTLLARPTFVPFDIVLMDPPYQPDNRADDMVEILQAASALMSPHAVIVLEHARRRGAPDAVGELVRTRELVSGDSALSFYALSAHQLLTD
jgi:16S rRNA (guanine(966)-N(2))-methyltransferase RsmD